jgi:UDP-N-acetylglucosamine 2-epimerase (non-hydrolysing)
VSENSKLILVAAARPNFMKVAPIIHAILTHNDGVKDGGSLAWRLVHTGQHYDPNMSEIFFRELGIPAPNINLGVGSGSHAEQTAGILVKFEAVCREELPDWVVVVGDVNSTLACTLVCSKLGVRVAHVEAGLRSHDRSMPEEINRIVTDALADLLLTPSADANENLRREGVPETKIELVGNVMIDSLLANLDKARNCGAVERLGLQPRDFVYVTLHRPSNVDDPTILKAILNELKRLSQQVPVIFPMHPRTRKMCSQFGLCLNHSAGLKVLEPIGYHDSVCLTERARLVLTDSGGLQEESTFFRTPCLTLRPNTERPVTITMGSNKLTTVEQLSADIDKLMDGPREFGIVPPLWDGKTSERILNSILARS